MNDDEEQVNAEDRLDFKLCLSKKEEAVKENGDDGRHDPTLKLEEADAVLISILLNNEDILEHILSRLPIQSLLRLRSVCKGWRHLINDDRFAASHQSRQPDDRRPFTIRGHGFEQPSWHLRREGNNLSLQIAAPLSPKQPIDHPPLLLKSSLKGLLLFSRSYSSHACFYVGNPITGEFVQLPPVLNCFLVLVGQLMEDEGLHKVLVIYLNLDRRTKVTTLVFTLGVDVRWRKFANPYDDSWGWWHITDSFPCLNGAFHRVHGDHDIKPVRNFVAAFDVKEEKIREIEYPYAADLTTVGSHRKHHFRDVAVVRRKLCLLHFDLATKDVDAWFLEEYQNRRWRKDHSINLSHIYKELPFEVGVISGMTVPCVYGTIESGDHRGDEVLLKCEWMLDDADGRMRGRMCVLHLCYRPWEKTITKVKVECDHFKEIGMYLGMYVESLVRVKAHKRSVKSSHK